MLTVTAWGLGRVDEGKTVRWRSEMMETRVNGAKPAKIKESLMSFGTQDAIQVIH